MILDFLKLHATLAKNADEKDQNKQNQDNANNTHKDNTTKVENTKSDIVTEKHKDPNLENKDIVSHEIDPADKSPQDTEINGNNSPDWTITSDLQDNESENNENISSTDWTITDDLEDDDKCENDENATDWTITDDLYDDIPEDPDHLAEVDAKATIENLLSKSISEIADLRKYILSKEIQPIPKKDIIVGDMLQYFLDGDLAYPLTEEICLHIDNVLGDLTSPEIVSKVLEKDKLKLKPIMLRIKESLAKSARLHPIIKSITPHVATQLAMKVLTQTYTLYISKRFQKEQNFNLHEIIYPLNETATSIGNLIIETYVYK